MFEKLRLNLLLLTKRKEAEYIKRTGSIPLCNCAEYLDSGNCEHMEELSQDFYNFINNYMKDTGKFTGKIYPKYTEYKQCYVNEEGYLIQVISTEKGYIEKKYGPLQLIKD